MKSIGTQFSKPLCILLMLLSVALPTQNAIAQSSSEPVCLYSQANFQGDKYCADTSIGFVPLRFTTRSIKLASGYQITAYRLPFFIGATSVQPNDNRNFNALGGNIRSFKLNEVPVETSNSAAAIVPIISLLLSEKINPDDYDDDGFSNDTEDEYGTDPRDPNSTPPDIDGDKIPDDVDDDRDGDGIDNVTEGEEDTDPNDPADFPDLVPPLLIVNNVTGLKTTSEQILVTGSAVETVQPYSGFAELFIQSDAYPGTNFTGSRNEQTGEFSIEVPLKLGANNLSVIARDEVGNESRSDLLVSRGITPLIININPANGTVSVNDAIDISGQIRSNLPIGQFTLVINNSQVVTTGTNQDDLYDFNFANVPLQLGENRFEFKLSSDFGGDTQVVIVDYAPEGGDTLPAPSITGVNPANEASLNRASFRLGAQVESSAGPLTVLVNGNEVLNQDQGLTFYSVNEVVTFPAGENTVTTTIEASDSLGKTTTETVTHNRDNSGPVLRLDQGFQPIPQVTQVDRSPVRFSGVVSDDNLSSISINGQPVQLSPGNAPNTYTFDVNIAVEGEQATPVSILAFDRSGNRSAIEYSMLNIASASVKAILPPQDTTYLSRDNDLNVQVAARLNGNESTDQVVAYLQSAGASSAVTLTINNTLASGDIVIPKGAAKQTIVFELRNAQGRRITQDFTNVEVKAAQDVELEVVRVEPANNARFVEPNAAIEIYFNKQIDVSKLEISVKETLHGKSYVNSDELGEDFIRAKGYELVDINRDQAPVSGQVVSIPNDSAAIFSVNESYGYSAQVFLEVSYDGQELLRSRFSIRELPTLINGSIADQFGQPLAGIKVSLPELERETTTNGDGGFAFGYQEGADQVIPRGTYKLVVNDGFANPDFGTINTRLSITRNRQNPLPRYSLQELDKSISFYNLESGRSNSLAGGDLVIDLSNARAIFPNTRTSGPVHAQFLPIEHVGVKSYDSAISNWLFGIQPKGIIVEGDVSLKIRIPKLRDSYDYIDSDSYKYVVLLGYSEEGQVVEPIGVGEISNLSVTSVGELALSSIDFIGYAQVFPSLTGELEKYAEGELSLQQLKAQLQQAVQQN